MADRVIRALITADAAQANAEMQAAADRATAASAQAQEALDAEAAAADASAEDISAAMAAMEADYAGAGLASGDMAVQVDAALADLKASMAETDGAMTTTVGDISVAMGGIGTESEIAAERMSASMAQIDASLSLASSDTAVSSDEMSASMDTAGDSAEAAKMKFLGFDLATLGPLAVAAAAAGAAYESIKMADEFDKATNSIAADAGISQKAAQKISDSFLDASNTTIYNATDIANAYSGVAAQLASVQGHALSAAQAQRVMNAAQNLATATGSDLGSATSALATVMQAYGQKSSSAAADSNILFNAARLTGGGIATVTSAVQKLVAGLGVAAPSLGNIGGLIEDLATHGETGRKAISAVTSGFNALITTSLGVKVANRNMASDMAGLTGPALALAQQLQAGTLSSYNYGEAVEQLGGKQGELATDFGTAYTASETAQAKLANLGITVDTSKGKFVGIGSVISQLHAVYLAHGADAAQAAASDALGATAADKLMKTIEAGPAAYQKDVAAVEKANSAHKAAEKQLQNLGDMWKEVLAHAEDFAVGLGEAVMPVLTDAGHVVSKVTSYFSENKNAVNAAKIILGALGITLAVMVAPSLWATATAAWGVAAPFLAVAIPIAAVAAGFFLLYTHVTIFRDIVNDIISIVGTVLVGAFNVAKDAVSDLVGAFETAVGYGQSAVNFFSGLPKAIGSAFGTLASAITAPFKSAFDDVAGIWNNSLGKLSFSIPGWVPGLGGDKFSLPKIPVLATGGMVTGSGLAYLDAGEVVVNPQQQQAAMGGSSVVNANFYGVTTPQDIVNALKLYIQQNGTTAFRGLTPG